MSDATDVNPTLDLDVEPRVMVMLERIADDLIDSNALPYEFNENDIVEALCSMTT